MPDTIYMIFLPFTSKVSLTALSTTIPFILERCYKVAIGA